MTTIMLLNATLHRLPAAVAKAAAATRTAASSSRSISSCLGGIGLPTIIDTSLQQLAPSSATGGVNTTNTSIRYRWTKAKKKRVARYERRQQLEKEGKSLPNPPYYFPKDTEVVNVRTKEDLTNESQKFDEQAATEMRQKLREQQPVLRHNMSSDNLTMSDRVRKLFDLHNGNQMEVVKAQKHRGMELFQLREGDTGSSAVQVIALTTRIQQLQTHFSRHKKDKHSKRGLDALYVRRRKLLDYMERKDFDNYRKVVKSLGLVR